MKINFTAIDVETAIGKRWSICQIGIVRVENGVVVKKISKLVKPPNNIYSDWNIRIHGIQPCDTINAQVFSEVWNEIKSYFENELIVAHNAVFDIDCINKSLDYYKIPRPNIEHDCTYKRTGLKLDNVCTAYGVNLKNHHDALNDALACAEVYLKILKNYKPIVSKLINKNKINNFQIKGHERIQGDLLKPNLENADPSSPFYGKKVVFTGVLSSIKRQEAAVIVKKLGADIDTVISKKTNLVITGKAPGPSKMKKIEKYNSQNSNIKIVLENEFLKMINKN